MKKQLNIRLDEDILKELKKLAIDEEKTVTEIVEHSILYHINLIKFERLKETEYEHEQLIIKDYNHENTKRTN